MPVKVSDFGARAVCKSSLSPGPTMMPSVPGSAVPRAKKTVTSVQFWRVLNSSTSGAAKAVIAMRTRARSFFREHRES